MKRNAPLAMLCLGMGLAIPLAAQAQQSQQYENRQTGQQQFRQQMPGQSFGQQQQQQQQLTEQQIRNFFQQTENVLQRTARTQDPAQLQQYLQQYLVPDATITSASELFVGDTHVASSVSKVTDEMAIDALGYAAAALSGRKMVSDYNINIRVTDIKMLPGQNSARVTTVIQESGVFGRPTPRVAQAPGQQPDGSMQQQWTQGQQQGQQYGQLGQGQQGWGQRGWSSTQNGQQGWTGMQTDRQSMGQQGTGQQGTTQQGMNQQGMGVGAGGGQGGGPEQGVRFQSRATCTHLVTQDQGQIRIGDTFCRGAMRLG